MSDLSNDFQYLNSDVLLTDAWEVCREKARPGITLRWLVWTKLEGQKAGLKQRNKNGSSSSGCLQNNRGLATGDKMCAPVKAVALIAEPSEPTVKQQRKWFLLTSSKRAQSLLERRWNIVDVISWDDWRSKLSGCPVYSKLRGSSNCIFERCLGWFSVQNIREIGAIIPAGPKGIWGMVIGQEKIKEINVKKQNDCSQHIL